MACHFVLIAVALGQFERSNSLQEDDSDHLPSKAVGHQMSGKLRKATPIFTMSAQAQSSHANSIAGPLGNVNITSSPQTAGSMLQGHSGEMQVEQAQSMSQIVVKDVGNLNIASLQRLSLMPVPRDQSTRKRGREEDDLPDDRAAQKLRLRPTTIEESARSLARSLPSFLTIVSSCSQYYSDGIVGRCVYHNIENSDSEPFESDLDDLTYKYQPDPDDETDHEAENKEKRKWKRFKERSKEEARLSDAHYEYLQHARGTKKADTRIDSACADKITAEQESATNPKSRDRQKVLGQRYAGFAHLNKHTARANGERHAQRKREDVMQRDVRGGRDLTRLGPEPEVGSEWQSAEDTDDEQEEAADGMSDRTGEEIEAAEVDTEERGEESDEEGEEEETNENAEDGDDEDEEENEQADDMETDDIAEDEDNTYIDTDPEDVEMLDSYGHAWPEAGMVRMLRAVSMDATTEDIEMDGVADGIDTREARGANADLAAGRDGLLAGTFDYGPVIKLAVITRAPEEGPYI